MDVIVVGGGIAGLSAGIGLRRAGHKVIVLEQSSLNHETGAAITIAPNASRVLKSWNFDTKQSQMVSIAVGSIVDGVTMDTLVPDYFAGCEDKYGFPMYSVHRVDLHSQLRDLATQSYGPGHPVDVQTRARVVAYNSSEGSVTLADGQILRADLVVAADGVHSIAVGHVVDDAADERTTETGWATMRWLVPTKEFLADPETASLIKDSHQRYFTGGRGISSLVWYPCRNNEVQNFLYLSQAFDLAGATEDFRASVSPEAVTENAKQDFSPEIQAVLSKAKDVKFWKLVARQPLLKWHKDRLVLIGDAAHPMLPFQAQGGGQAIEDGAALSVLFDGVKDPATIESRLQLFEEIRRNRGSSLQLLSNHSHPQPQSVRDAAAQYIPGNKKFETPGDVNEYVFSFDVIKESKAILV